MTFKNWLCTAWQEIRSTYTHPETIFGRIRMRCWCLRLEWNAVDFQWRMLLWLMVVLIGVCLILGATALIILHQLLMLVGC